MDDYSIVSRKLARSEKNTMFFYLAMTVPIQIIFFFLVLDLVRSLVAHSSPFTLGGFVIIVVGLVYHWHQDMRYPIPSLRECPRTFYFINEYLATVESATYDQIDKAILHKHPSGLGDIFLVVAQKGCLRLKCVPEAKEFYDKIEAQRKVATPKPLESHSIQEKATAVSKDKTIDNKQIEKFVEEVERLVESQKNDSVQAAEEKETKESTKESAQTNEPMETLETKEEKEKEI